MKYPWHWNLLHPMDRKKCKTIFKVRLKNTQIWFNIHITAESTEKKLCVLCAEKHNKSYITLSHT